MLSISVLSDSDSIHRKTRITGETITTTDAQKPSLRSQRLAGARAAEDAMRAVAALTSRVPLGLLAHVQQHEGEGEHDHEEHDDHRGGVADVVERERLQVEVQVDGFRRRAGPAAGDHVDRVESL